MIFRTALLLRIILLGLCSAFAAFGQAGTGALIEQRLTQLRNNAFVDPLPEIPTDESEVPADWLALVSWNIQVGGTSPSSSASRPPLVADALGRLFSGSYQLLAAQEISSSAHSAVLQGLLPGGASEWTPVFFDSTDAQDNGFWIRPSVAVRQAGLLLTTGITNPDGRILTDPLRAVHPPAEAHFTVGDFDFTLITVHLTFAGGDTSESAREMRELLDYLDTYFARPGHDPDVIISGDFNTPSRLSGSAGSGGIQIESVFDADPRFQIGERRFVVLVHEPTSRRTVANGGVPANNYDHFILSADALEELVQARRVAPEILTANPDDPELRLTSDHFPIVAFFKTRGENVSLDVGQNTPQISAIVHGASFLPGIAPGAWITIFGDNLAPTMRTWRGDEIVDGRLPTELDGVGVLVNGKPAAVFYIGPGQLNVQAPDDDARGPVLVEVLRDGVLVASASADSAESAPGLFTVAAGGQVLAAAIHPDGTFVGDPDQLGFPARPAQPGDVILFFGSGFGPTSPPVPSGEVFFGAAPLDNPVRVQLGGLEATVQFAGLSGAGLNQLNVVVPEGIASGPVEVVAETLGLQTQLGVRLTIAGGGAPPPPDPTVMLSASPLTIDLGQPTTLTWSSANALSASISPGVGAVDLSGSLQVSPLETTTYVITVEGEVRAANASVTVTVRPPPAPPPTVALTVAPETIDRGDSTTLSWSSTNAASASIAPGVGSVALSGSIEVSPVQSTTYTVTVQGPGGTAAASVNVTVQDPPAATNTVVISQLYGGGGNSGSMLANDFVELFNRGSSTVDLNGWTVQYASATGGTWRETVLSGAVAPGRYYLVQEGTGNTGAPVSLPPPDATGGIGLSATSGKLALVSGATLLSGPSPADPRIVDFVGYGSAGASEGSAAPRLSNTTAAQRLAGGCSDSNNNAADFVETAPSPRNSNSPANPCN